jgi:hypothetical protein
MAIMAKICGTACFVAVVFTLSTLLFPLLLDREVVGSYHSKLPPAAQTALKAATKERSMLAFRGLVLGMIVGAVTVLLLGKTGKAMGVCVLASIAFVVQFLYYMLSPKSAWVVKHLHTTEQRKDWVKVYREYQTGYYGSIAIGVIGAGLLGYGLC